MKKIFIILAAAASLMLASCRYISVEPSYEPDGTAMECELDATVPLSYDGGVAKDADTPGTDANIYWEANDFSNKVSINYANETAEVTTTYSKVDVKVDGAHVSLDFASQGGSNVEVILTGSSKSGNLTIKSDAKLKLALSGVSLASNDGSAICFLSEETLFVDCPDGKNSILADGLVYSAADDIVDDMKGCLYSGGPVIFSGKGTVKVSGNYRNGISTESHMWIRPGSTVVIDKASLCGVSIVGSAQLDEDGDFLGLTVKGGYLYSKTDADGGFAVDCGTNFKMYGGEAYLYTTGDSKFISSLLDLQKTAALRTEQDVIIYDGVIEAKSSGSGARAIRAHGGFYMYDGDLLVTTSGKYYKYHNLVSKPRALELDTDLYVDNGKLDVAAVSKTEHSSAIVAGKKLTINNGQVYAYAFDDAAKVQDFEINDGYFFAFSANEDAINSDNDIIVNNGLVEVGAKSSAFQHTGSFYIGGGTLLGIYGLSALPDSLEQSYGVYASGISGNTGDVVSVLEGNKTVFSFQIPRSRYSSKVLFSSDNQSLDNRCEIYKWGHLDGAVTRHRLLLEGGTFTGGYYVDTLSRVVY